MIVARRLQRGFPDGLIAGEVEDLWEASAAKSARLAHALPQRGAWRVSPGSEVIGRVHRRTVGIALEKKVVAGRRMRVDATVAETNITIRSTARRWATA